MACWFNLPGGFFQIAFMIFGMWWRHHSDFFVIPMSPSFHYLAGCGAGKKWNWQSCPQVAAVSLLLCLWHHFSWCRLPFPGLGDKVEQAGDLCCQGQVALTAWAGAKPEHFSWQSLGQGLSWGWAPKHLLRPPMPGQGRAGQGPWLKQLLGHWQQVMSEYHLPLLCCRSVTPESLTEQEPEVPPAGNWDLDPKLLRLSSASLFSKQNLLSVSKFPFQFFLENPAANGFKCSVCV